MGLPRNILRFSCERTNPLDPRAQFAFDSNVIARLPKARASQWEFEFTCYGIIDAPSDLITLTLEVKPLTSAGVINPAASNVMAQTIAAAAFNLNLTEDQWRNRQGVTPWHAVFLFADTESPSNTDMANSVNNELNFGWVLTGLTAIGNVDVASGLVTCVNGGGTPGAAAVPPVTAYTLSDAQILALFAACVKFGGNPAGAGIPLTGQNGTVINLFNNDSDASAPKLESPQIA